MDTVETVEIGLDTLREGKAGLSSIVATDDDEGRLDGRGGLSSFVNEAGREGNLGLRGMTLPLPLSVT